MKPTVIDLFGTDEPRPERRMLRAGPLSVVLENGGLRDIRFHGVEAIRAITYLSRDSAWGTYRAAISDLSIEEGGGHFTVGYSAVCGTGDEQFAYRMHITGDASGHLVLDAEGEALGDFHTNRTGFVVLHPAEAAGGKLTIVHGDGSREETKFPTRISPDQPTFDIAALIHQPAPGLTCDVAMAGDVFEMEDQRNWADASFKTYVRPLSKPRPYVIGKGERDIQQIAVRLTGAPATTVLGSSEEAVLLDIGERIGCMPKIALFVDAAHLPDERQISGLPRPCCSDLIARFDLRAGHDTAYLAELSGIARRIGAALALELIFDARDPVREAAAFLAAISAARIKPSALLVAPRREFKTRPSNILPEGEQDTDALVAALRGAGALCPIGAGTPSNFTEFNRNPPGGGCDFVFFGVAAIVHAADDMSVMETPSVYPALIDSARALTPGKPIWLGPCTLATRHNPYGAGVVANPDRKRIAAAGDDPRQQALFGAGYAVAVAARAVSDQVDRLTLAAPSGPFGLVGGAGQPRPVAAVNSLLAVAAGTACWQTDCGHFGLAAIAFGEAGNRSALVANLTAEPIDLDVPPQFHAASILEANGEWTAIGIGNHRVEIAAYRVVQLQGR